MELIVCIDPGHGGTASGAVNEWRCEKDDNLRLAVAVGAILSGCGVTVRFTRKADEAVSIADRKNIANNSGAVLFLSVHRNAHFDKQANGLETIYKDLSSIGFANCVHRELVGLGIFRDRGVKQMDLPVLTSLKIPACLVEVGFISNDNDNELFDKYFNQHAQAIARGVVAALDKDYRWGDDMRRYAKFDDLPDWAKPTVKKLTEPDRDGNVRLAGVGNNVLDLSEDMLRLLVINDRSGLYDQCREKYSG